MAGIGFELKKLFDEKGIVSKLRAYTYTATIVTGPMLLGITFIAVVQILGTMMGLDFQHRTLLICMFTYALLGSLVLTGIVAMPITRYIADML